MVLCSAQVVTERESVPPMLEIMDLCSDSDPELDIMVDTPRKDEDGLGELQVCNVSESIFGGSATSTEGPPVLDLKQQRAISAPFKHVRKAAPYMCFVYC